MTNCWIFNISFLIDRLIFLNYNKENELQISQVIEKKIKTALIITRWCKTKEFGLSLKKYFFRQLYLLKIGFIFYLKRNFRMHQKNNVSHIIGKWCYDMCTFIFKTKTIVQVMVILNSTTYYKYICWSYDPWCIIYRQNLVELQLLYQQN